MDAAAGDRGHVDDAALRQRQLVDEAARQRHRREEIHVEDLPPQVERRVHRAEPAAVLALGRDGGVVHQRIEPAAGEARADLLDAAADIDRIGEVELHVVLAAARPRAERAEGLARDGDDPPAAGAEFLDRRMADAAACAGQNQGPDIVAREGCIHGLDPTPLPSRFADDIRRHVSTATPRRATSLWGSLLFFTSSIKLIVIPRLSLDCQARN